MSELPRTFILLCTKFEISRPRLHRFRSDSGLLFSLESCEPRSNKCPEQKATNHQLIKKNHIHTHKTNKKKKPTIQQIPQSAFFFLAIRKTLTLKSWKNPPSNCYFLSFFHCTFSWIYFLLPVLILQSFCKILCGYVSPTYRAGTTLCMRLGSHQERKSCQSLEIL